MAKSKFVKKIIKSCAIIFLGIITAGLLMGAGSYVCLTHNCKLDKSLLSTHKQGVVLTDIAGKEINSYLATNDTSPINQITKQAFIAKEDKRFFEHSGVDYIRILGALKNNIKSGSISQGGSTITQQLIKNTHLSQEKTIKRKLKEMKLSKELEKNYSKDEILDVYLNTIYFGNNIFGIRSASSFYFGKKATDLTIAESAILAGIISAPSVYNPIANPKISKEKANMVLNLMEEQNFINYEQKSIAIQEIEDYIPQKTTPVGSLYTSFATSEALEILGLKTLPQNSNIIIKTYMDTTLQSNIDKMVKSADYKANDVSNTMSGIATIAIDNNTGGIIAFGGDSIYNLMELKRQPASTIKPILVYGPALEENLISPATFVLDEPININGYSPHNATKTYAGWTTIRDNIVRSTNIPAVKILQETGIEKSKNFAAKLGINFSSGDNNLAIALGGMEDGVTIKEIATAYMCLARGGNYVNSTFIDEIIINGLSVYKNQPKGIQVMKDSTAYLLTDMLKSVAEYGTARRLELPFEVASKTGTNAINGINHDAWNVGYTNDHTIACWMGNLGEVLSTNSSQFNGSLYSTLFVKDAMEILYKNKRPQGFVIPSTVTKVNLDADMFNYHQLFAQSPNSTNFVTELFSLENLPPKLETSQQITNLAEEFNKNNTAPQLDYLIFAKKYGIW